MMTRHRGRSGLRVGIFAIAAMLAFTALFIHSTNRVIGADRTTIFVRLPRADGLQRGDAVLHRGVGVGEVREIAFDEDGVLVRVRLTRPVPLSAGARARMVAVDLFGRQSIVLHEGDSARRPLADGDTLAGKGPVPMTARFEQLGERAGALLSDRTVDGLHTLLEDAGGAAAVTADAAAEIAGAARSARAVVDEQGAALGRLAVEAQGLMQDVRTVTDPDELAALRTELHASATRLASATATMDTAATRLAGLLAGLEAGRGSAGLLLTDAELYDRAAGSLAALERLLDDLRENPKRYLTVKIF